MFRDDLEYTEQEINEYESYYIAQKDGLEVRIRLSQPSSSVEYRIEDHGPEWKCTPFQAADCQDESDAFTKVDTWLEG